MGFAGHFELDFAVIFSGIKQSEGGIAVAYNISLFSNAIIKLLEDKKLQKEMAEKGARYILNNCTYKVMASEIDKYFR